MLIRWMQVFLYRDDFTQELVRRAEVVDYDTLTIDNQVLGKRERDLANGFTIPPKFSPANTAMLSKYKWFGDARRTQQDHFGNYVRREKGRH